MFEGANALSRHFKTGAIEKVHTSHGETDLIMEMGTWQDHPDPPIWQEAEQEHVRGHQKKEAPGRGHITYIRGLIFFKLKGFENVENNFIEAIANGTVRLGGLIAVSVKVGSKKSQF